MHIIDRVYLNVIFIINKNRDSIPETVLSFGMGFKCFCSCINDIIIF